jgi:DNA-binding GntR family transcriptional regulator
VNGFLRRLLNYDLVIHLAEERRKQNCEIEALHAEVSRLQLAHARNVRDLVSHFHHCVVEGEDMDFLEETLEAGLRDMNDSVARLEEHSA